MRVMDETPCASTSGSGESTPLGQRYPMVKISNLRYGYTLETDVYRALAGRINLFQIVVAPGRPILAKLLGTITSTVLGDSRAARAWIALVCAKPSNGRWTKENLADSTSTPSSTRTRRCPSPRARQ